MNSLTKASSSLVSKYARVLRSRGRGRGLGLLAATAGGEEHATADGAKHAEHKVLAEDLLSSNVVRHGVVTEAPDRADARWPCSAEICAHAHARYTLVNAARAAVGRAVRRARAARGAHADKVRACYRAGCTVGACGRRRRRSGTAAEWSSFVRGSQRRWRTGQRHAENTAQRPRIAHLHEPHGKCSGHHAAPAPGRAHERRLHLHARQAVADQRAPPRAV